MKKKRLQEQCSGTSKESSIEVLVRGRKTLYTGFDTGRLILILSEPVTRISNKVRKLFFDRMQRREKNKPIKKLFEKLKVKER